MVYYATVPEWGNTNKNRLVSGRMSVGGGKSVSLKVILRWFLFLVDIGFFWFYEDGGKDFVFSVMSVNVRLFLKLLFMPLVSVFFNVWWIH